jgi:hypothetical protein
MSRKDRNKATGATPVNEPKVLTPVTEVTSESTETLVATEVTEGAEHISETEVIDVDGADESAVSELDTGTETDDGIIDAINEELEQLQNNATELESPVAEAAEAFVGSEPALPVEPAVIDEDARPLHIKLIEQWLLGDTGADEAYVVAMAPGRTVSLSILFHQQQTLLTVIRYLLGLKGQEFFEGMERWLEIVDEYSEGAFGPKYALRGLNEKTAPFTRESADLLQRFVTLSQRIANVNSRSFVLKQCIDTTVALNKLMDPEAREKLNAWFSQYE